MSLYGHLCCHHKIQYQCHRNWKYFQQYFYSVWLIFLGEPWWPWGQGACHELQHHSMSIPISLSLCCTLSKDIYNAPKIWISVFSEILFCSTNIWPVFMCLVFMWYSNLQTVQLHVNTNWLYAKERSQLACQGTKPANKVSQETKSLSGLGDQGISVDNDKWKQGAGIAGDCSIRPVWNSRPEELAEQLWLMLCLTVLNEPSQQEPVCWCGPGAAMHQLQLVLLLLNLVLLLPPLSFDTRGWIQVKTTKTVGLCWTFKYSVFSHVSHAGMVPNKGVNTILYSWSFTFYKAGV